MEFNRDIYSIFGIEKGLTAIIGGGGKTSLLLHLAAVYQSKESVIVATSTHIYPPADYPLVHSVDRGLLDGDCLVVGKIGAGGKLGPPKQPFSELMQYADYLFVEADGSRGFPMKAHAEHEPVIPKEASGVIAVVGLDGIGKPIKDAAHRPQLYASRVGAHVDDILTEDMCAAMLLTYPQVTGIVLNKADSLALLACGERIAAKLPFPVILTSYQPKPVIYQLWRNGKCLLS